MIGTFYAVGKLSYSPCHGQADRSREQHSSGCVVPTYSPCSRGLDLPHKPRWSRGCSMVISNP